MSHWAKKQTLQVWWWWSGNDKWYFTDITALNTAYPSGSDWWYAVLGSTDTIWIWDSGTSAWVDSWWWWSGTPWWSDTEIQVNNAWAFAWYPELKYDNTTKELIIGAEDDYGWIRWPDATTLDAFWWWISLYWWAWDWYGNGGSLAMVWWYSLLWEGGGFFMQWWEWYLYQGWLFDLRWWQSYSGDGWYFNLRWWISTYWDGGEFVMQWWQSSYWNAWNLEMLWWGWQFAVGGSFFMQWWSGIVWGNFTLQPWYWTWVTDGIYTFSVVHQWLWYVIGDTVEVNGTAGTKSIFIINEVWPLGEAYTVNRITLEWWYTTGTQTTTTLTGIWTGLTIDITSLVTWDIGKIFLKQASNTWEFKTELDISALTANQVHTFPDQSGTIALTSDIPTGLIKLPTYTVGASGADYTTIQWAIDAATTGGTIYVIDWTYTQTSTLLFKYNNTRIVGNGMSTKIVWDGSTVTTLVWFNTSNIKGCSLENLYFENTNVSALWVWLDFSNTPLNKYKDLYFFNFNVAIKANDTANYTFYNHFTNINIFECNNGFDFTSTNPINNNWFENIRIALKAWWAGKWLYMNNAQGNTFTNFNAEPWTWAGITGIHLDTNLVINTVFINPYLENNNVWVNISSSQRTMFIWGMIVANTTNVTDTGLDTAFLNTNVNYVLYQQMVNMEFYDKSNASRIAWRFRNNTSFAHNSSNLIEMELLNGSDTSNILQLKNAWSGKYITALSGSTELFSVDTSGSSSTMLSQVKNIINKNTTLNAWYSAYVPWFLEIADTYTLTVSDTSYLQVW